MSTTPRIQPPAPAETTDFGSVMMHTPQTLTTFFQLYGAFWQGGTLPPDLKELTRLRNARITDCGY